MLTLSSDWSKSKYPFPWIQTKVGCLWERDRKTCHFPPVLPWNNRPKPSPTGHAENLLVSQNPTWIKQKNCCNWSKSRKFTHSQDFSLTQGRVWMPWVEEWETHLLYRPCNIYKRKFVCHEGWSKNSEMPHSWVSVTQNLLKAVAGATEKRNTSAP